MDLATYLAMEELRPAQFAARLHRPTSTITRLVRGETRPSLGLMEAIAAATRGRVLPNDFAVLPRPGGAKRERKPRG
jgi:transcriptional regulator with XRE-family HTH domain